jgi:hypothetical protein
MMTLVVVIRDLLLPIPPVHITTTIVSSNTFHGKVYLIQHYVIKFVSDLWQAGGFPADTSDSSTNIADRQDITEIYFDSGVKHYNSNPSTEKYCYANTNIYNVKIFEV